MVDASMRISVIVPTWNRADLLPATLDAIFGQTVPPDEVIVVDDGSTDDTQAMLSARYAGRVQAIRIANGGDLVARNAGLALASGDLVAFCDSDDLWRPGFLATMAAMWRAEPRMRVAFSDFVLVRDGQFQDAAKFDAAPGGFWDGLRLLGSGLAVFDQPIVARLVEFQPFFPSAMVADRDFLRRIGGWDASVGRIVGCDFATALLLAEHAPFGIVRQPLVGIRKHADNHSADVQKMNLGDSLVLEHVLARRPALAPLAAPIGRSVARRRRQALDLAFSRHDHAAVRDIYALLPPAERHRATQMKACVSRLPAPLRALTGRALLAAGSIRARLAR